MALNIWVIAVLARTMLFLYCSDLTVSIIAIGTYTVSKCWCHVIWTDKHLSYCGLELNVNQYSGWNCQHNHERICDYQWYFLVPNAIWKFTVAANYWGLFRTMNKVVPSFVLPKLWFFICCLLFMSSHSLLLIFCKIARYAL